MSHTYDESCHTTICDESCHTYIMSHVTHRWRVMSRMYYLCLKTQWLETRAGRYFLSNLLSFVFLSHVTHYDESCHACITCVWLETRAVHYFLSFHLSFFFGIFIFKIMHSTCLFFKIMHSTCLESLETCAVRFFLSFFLSFFFWHFFLYIRPAYMHKETRATRLIHACDTTLSRM